MGLLDFLTKPAKKAPRTLRPLTRGDAMAMGHVLWVETKDPQQAFEQMYLGLKKAPYNCAIWANAGDRIAPADLTLLQDWRRANNLSVGQVVQKPQRENQSVRKFGADYLRAYFNQLMVSNRQKPGIEKVLTIIYHHMNDNFEGMNSIIPSKDMVIQLRGAGFTKAGFNDEHIDSPRDGDYSAMRIQLRVLQSIASLSTCIIANDDVVIKKRDSNQPAESFVEYKSDPKKPVTIWQTPRNSVIMLTNSSHHCQPILHCDAVTPPGLADQPRIVSVTGLSL